MIILVFRLRQPGEEPHIFHTRDEHSYHYPTDTVVYDNSQLNQD